MTDKITSFRGKYRFLSNFYPAEVEMDGLVYPTVENAYQAAKSTNPILRLHFTTITPLKAKKEAPIVIDKAEWFEKSLGLMEDLVRQKFTKHEELKQKLIDTFPRHIEEGNNWGDRFWGTVDGEGNNHLGKILMRIRRQVMVVDYSVDILPWSMKPFNK